jgi:prepilin-type processing-associated H-X9-DG protein
MKAPRRGEWILWTTPLVALAPVWLGHVLSDWPPEWSWTYSSDKARRSSCQSNLKRLGMALLEYSQDYDEKFPPATIGGVAFGDRPLYFDNGKRSTAFGWVDVLGSYHGERRYLFYCPSQNPSFSQANTHLSPTSRGFTDYWINARITRRATNTLSRPGQTFLLGDGNDGRDESNATYSKSGFMHSWLEDASSPMYRHLDGANYLFADGHVKWLRPHMAQFYAPDPFAP